MVERAVIEPAQTQDFTLVLYLAELLHHKHLVGTMGFEPIYYSSTGCCIRRLCYAPYALAGPLRDLNSPHEIESLRLFHFSYRGKLQGPPEGFEPSTSRFVV